MIFGLMEINPDDEARAWELFPNSPMQRAMNNFLVKEMTEKRQQVDRMAASDLPKVQAELAALKSLLGFIHRKNSLPTK